MIEGWDLLEDLDQVLGAQLAGSTARGNERRESDLVHFVSYPWGGWVTGWLAPGYESTLMTRIVSVLPEVWSTPIVATTISPG